MSIALLANNCQASARDDPRLVVSVYARVHEPNRKLMVAQAGLLVERRRRSVIKGILTWR